MVDRNRHLTGGIQQNGTLEQGSNLENGNFNDVRWDNITAQQISELNKKKSKAIEDEDYDLAKAIKQDVDRLKAIGIQILELERRYF